MPEYLSLNSIRENAFNPNVMTEEEFKDLVEDMRRVGPEGVDPIHVRRLEDGYEIIDGAHRFRVAQELGWNDIRCWVHEMDESEARAFNYEKNRLRGRIDPFKEAELFKWELDRGLSDEEIAKKYGLRHRQRVWEKLSLLNIAPEVRGLCPTGRTMTEMHLRAIARLEHPEQQMKLAKGIVEEHLSYREAERRAAQIKLESQVTTQEEEAITEERPSEVTGTVQEPERLKVEVIEELIGMGHVILTDEEFPIATVKPDIYFPEYNVSVFIDGPVHEKREDLANRELLSKRYRQRVLTVRYEDYTKEQREEVLKEILEFLGQS